MAEESAELTSPHHSEKRLMSSDPNAVFNPDVPRAPIASSSPHRAEVLMPAGSLERLKTALLYGADAVYAGTPDLSLRTQTDFSLDDIKRGIRFAHDRGKRVYLTLNLFAHNSDIAKLPVFIETLKGLSPDGVIVADPGVFAFVREAMPEVDIHISTQANVNSWLTVKFWEGLGASLVVLAREVSFAELTEIRERCPDVKLETFVHGSVCMTYSGRCLLSNFMAERGANQGGCAHSCRWKYKVHVRMKDGRTKALEINDDNRDMFEFLLEEELRPGELMEIEEDQHGAYILNAKDLCLMPKLPDLLALGVDSLKVEGRNKGPYYAAVVARAYRAAVDAWYADPEGWDAGVYMQELATVSHRGYTLGFHEGRLTNLAHDYDEAYSGADWQFSGFVKRWEGDDMVYELRNYLRSGDVVEFVPPPGGDGGTFRNIRLRLYTFTDAVTGEVTERVSAGQGKAIRIPASAFDREDPATLQGRLPPMTAARRETPRTRLTQHVKKRHLAMDVELGKLDEDRYDEHARSLVAAPAPPKKRKNAHPAATCCGRGCNGCLRFWHDDAYAAARAELKHMGTGARLPRGWAPRGE